MKKHYKLFKKGKNWCAMAIMTAVAIAGITLSMNSVQADATVANTPETLVDVSGYVDGNSNQSSKENQQLSNEQVKSSTNNNTNNVSDGEKDTVHMSNYASAVNSSDYILNNQKYVTENGWGSDGLYYQNGQVVKNSTINVDDGTYWLDDNGQIAKDHFQEQDGKMYYFGLDGKEYKNQFYQNWGHTYYFGDDGARWDNRFYQNWGHTYYFGNDGARWDNRFYQNWGHTYYFGDDGARWDNRYYFNWGNTYYFGSDGARWDNKLMNAYGSQYYFQNDGSLLKNGTYTFNGLNYWANGDGVLTPEFNNAVNNYIINHRIQHAQIIYDTQALPSGLTGVYSGTSNGKPNMIIVHETANPGDVDVWGEINYESHTYENAFVHAFVDGRNIVQISDTNKEAWGAGYPANGRAIQFEQVEVHNGWDFAAELVNGAYYTAYQMKQYGLYPSLVGWAGNDATLWTHHDVSNRLGGTDHTDPDAYWSNRASIYFGSSYTIWNFFQLVNYEYNLL